jgi:hypothetical protein
MPPKKCTSVCTKKKTLDECHSDPRCKYANGKIRKYCHLTNKYTFDSLCNIIQKNPTKLPRTKSLPSSQKYKEIRLHLNKTNKQTKKINSKSIKKKIPFYEIQGNNSSSNSSKQVKKTIKRKPAYIIESSETKIQQPIQKINPFNLIQEYSSSNSSKKVKRNMKRKPFTIIESSESKFQQPIQKLNPFNLIQGYSSSNSSKKVKKNMKRKANYIIESSSSPSSI